MDLRYDQLEQHLIEQGLSPSQIALLISESWARGVSTLKGLTVHCDVEPQQRATYRLAPVLITRAQLRKALELLRTNEPSVLFALAARLRESSPTIEITKGELAWAMVHPEPLNLEKTPQELADIIMKRVARKRDKEIARRK